MQVRKAVYILPSSTEAIKEEPLNFNLWVSCMNLVHHAQQNTIVPNAMGRDRFIVLSVIGMDHSGGKDGRKDGTTALLCKGCKLTT
jgi:hypothetical protein